MHLEKNLTSTQQKYQNVEREGEKKFLSPQTKSRKVMAKICAVGMVMFISPPLQTFSFDSKQLLTLLFTYIHACYGFEKIFLLANKMGHRISMKNLFLESVHFGCIGFKIIGRYLKSFIMMKSLIKCELHIIHYLP